MRTWMLAHALAILVAATGPATPQLAVAQTQKVAEREGIHGQTVRTPYISYAEFRNVAFGGQAVSKTSIHGTVTLGEIITVTSAGEVKSLLGEPGNLNRISYPNGDAVRMDLDYDGMKMEYFKPSGASSFRLRTMKFTSPEWSLTVGDKELHPGLAADKLNPSVRRAGYIYVARPGMAKTARQSGELEIMDTRAQITFDTDKNTGNVKMVRFHQII